MGIKGPLKLPTRRVFFRGIVDLEGMFRVMRNWFLDYHYEFEERTVKYKLTSEGGIKEHEWFCEKDVTDYIRYQIRCTFKIRDVYGVEVIRKGEKRSLSQCKILLEINPVVILDAYGRFGGSTFLNNLRDWLWTHVLKKDILFKYADQLDYRALKLQGVVKEYLDFEGKENAYAAKW